MQGEDKPPTRPPPERPGALSIRVHDISPTTSTSSVQSSIRPNLSFSDLQVDESVASTAQSPSGLLVKSSSMPSEMVNFAGQGPPSPTRQTTASSTRELATSPEGLGEGYVGRYDAKRQEKAVSFVASPPPSKMQHSDNFGKKTILHDDGEPSEANMTPVNKKIERFEGLRTDKGVKSFKASPLPEMESPKRIASDSRVDRVSGKEFSKLPSSASRSSSTECNILPFAVSRNNSNEKPLSDGSVTPVLESGSMEPPLEGAVDLQIVDGPEDVFSAKVHPLEIPKTLPLVHQMSGSSYNSAWEPDQPSSDSFSDVGSPTYNVGSKFQIGAGKQIIFTSSLSAGSRAIEMLLAEAWVDVEKRPVDVLSGEHMCPEFLAINPKQSIPVLVISEEKGSPQPSTSRTVPAESMGASEDTSSNLSEATTILRYLCQLSPVLQSWYPTDMRVRMRTDEYLDWHLQHMRGICSSLLTKAIFVKSQLKNKVMLEQLNASLMEKIAIFETAWLGTNKPGPYICGAEPTIADLVAVCELETPQFMGFDLSVFPTLEAWRERLQGRDGYQVVHGNLVALLKRNRISF